MRLRAATNRNAQPSLPRARYASCRTAAFTLAEVLVAMLFMVIVVPIVVEAMHVASLSGEVAARKSEAALVAERELNNSIVQTNWTQGLLNGTDTQAGHDYHWAINSQTWNQDSTMELVAIQVDYTAGGRDYSVKMSTLAPLQNTSPTGGQQ